MADFILSASTMNFDGRRSSRVRKLTVNLGSQSGREDSEKTGGDRLRSQMADSGWGIAETGCRGDARVGRARWLRIFDDHRPCSIPVLSVSKRRR